MNRHLHPDSLFTPRLFPRFLCLASPWDFHSMVASRNIISYLLAILGTSCVISDAGRVDVIDNLPVNNVNEAGSSDDNLFSTIGVCSSTSFACN